MVFTYYFAIALSGFVNVAFSALLYARRLPRHRLWPLWLAFSLAVSVALLIAFAFAENALFFDREDSVTVWGVVAQQVLVLGAAFGVLVCFAKAKPSALFLCFLSAVATSRIVADLYGIFESVGVLRFDWLNGSGGLGFIGANVLNWLIYYAMHMAAVFCVYLLFGRLNTDNRVENVYLLWMFLCILIICLAADSVISVYLRTGGPVAVLQRLVLILCSLTILLLRAEVQKRSAAKTELLLAERLIAQQARQYEQASQNIRLINVKCHDLRRQIRDFGRVGGVDAAEIAKIVRIYDSAVKTGCDALDVILVGYGLRCEAEKIDLSCMLDGSRLNALSVSDLHALFGNMLDNACEYLVTLADTDKRFVRIRSAERGEYYVLTVENYFEGELTFAANGLPVTAKQDSENHGFGTSSIRLIAEKYGGFADVEAACGLFIVRCCFPLARLSQRELPPSA